MGNDNMSIDHLRRPLSDARMYLERRRKFRDPQQKRTPSKLKTTLRLLEFLHKYTDTACPIPLPRSPTPHVLHLVSIQLRQKIFKKATPPKSAHHNATNKVEHIRYQTPEAPCQSSSCRSAGACSGRHSAHVERPRRCIRG